MSDLLKREIAWRCVDCHAELTNQGDKLVCLTCGADFKYQSGSINFLKLASKETKQQPDVIRDFFKRWPQLYYFVAIFFGPMVFFGISAKDFLNRFSGSGLRINVGSGPRKLAKDVVNVDVFPYEGVDIMANIERLPFQDGSVERIVCDNVLEHIKQPVQAVNEIKRILSPGGMAYISTPFLYPFHGSPSDYTRWTEAGLRNLFCDFEIVVSGVRSGIFSTLTVYLCYAFATLLSLGNATLYWMLVNMSMFIFWPIKLLDLLFFWLPKISHTAAVLYIVIKNKK